MTERTEFKAVLDEASSLIAYLHRQRFWAFEDNQRVREICQRINALRADPEKK